MCTTIRPKIRVPINLIFFICTRPFDLRLGSSLIWFFYLYTTIRPKIRDLINLTFLFVHSHSTKIIRVLIYIFISFVHDHSTKMYGSFLLFNLFTYNCVNIWYATFMAVLIYFVNYIHGSTALIFRTLYPWLYEILAETSWY